MSLLEYLSQFSPVPFQNKAPTSPRKPSMAAAITFGHKTLSIDLHGLFLVLKEINGSLSEAYPPAL